MTDEHSIDPDEELFTILYNELRKMAEQAMAGQPLEHTLQATALVNEAYLRMTNSEGQPFKDRAHFLSVASRAMRHLLVDHARKKNSGKRRPTGERVGFDAIFEAFESSSEDLEALDYHLQKLAKSDPGMAQAIELRFFGGADMAEAARAAGMPKRSFERRWEVFRHYLRAQLRAS